MGGTGKTTLAKEVGKELKKSKKFDQVIDSTVSYNVDVKKIQDDIAGPLGLKSLKDCTESERPRRLWSRLTNGEKILIILDDVWGYINFEEIGIPFKGDHKGCRILATTRNLSTCNQMECDRIIQLDLLPDEDAWILFKKHAGLSDNSSKKLLNKGRKIAMECKGLPIAIAVIASSLKTLQKSTPAHCDDENWGKIYKSLSYSYDNMKSEKAKELFLLCSIFPEDEEIPTETLTRLSIGVGHVGEIDDSYDACRNEIIVAKNKLIDSCLLLNSEFECVTMHDLVREVALWKADKKILVVNTSNKNQKSLVERAKNRKYLFCEGKGKDVFHIRFDGSKLEILIAYLDTDENNFVEVPNSFFENVKRLRVLYLSYRKIKHQTLSLPQSIHSLTNIRSLYLECFDLGDFSVVGNLHSLETLELVYCLINELPQNIAELKKLILLKLDDCRFERNNSFEVIGSCSSLEELYFIFYSSFDDLTMVENANLPKLQRFYITDLNNFSEEEEDWKIRNSLSGAMVDGFFSKVTFKYLVQKSEFLELTGLQGGWTNLIPDIMLPEDEGTHNLIELLLKQISQLQCLINTKHIDSPSQNVFSELVKLELRQMENLKELCSGPLPNQFLKNLEKLFISQCIHLYGTLFKSKLSLCNLKSLTIENCPMLAFLFQLSTTQSLVLLGELLIENCEQLKGIITDERKRKDLGEEIVDDDYNNAGGAMFPNLKTLRISRCHQLHFILPLLTAEVVPKLEIMEIRDCAKLKCIFGSYQYNHDEEQDLHQELKNIISSKLKVKDKEGLPSYVDIVPMKRLSSKDETKAQKELEPIKSNVFSLDSKDQLQDFSISSEDGEREKARVSFSVVRVEHTTIKDDGDKDIQETSKHGVTHSPEILPQIIEDSSFVHIVSRELKQLVSNEYLALKNLSLLTNFLVKHPYIHLNDNILSDRYKGFAYTCLAKLLSFLQTHSKMDILESKHTEFVELLKDVRSFGFNRDWLKDIEKRALSSEDALQKLLDSKHTLIQHMEDLKHQLEEMEAQILKVKATLSTPLGY